MYKRWTTSSAAHKPDVPAPAKWLAKFPSRCRSCGNTMPEASMVEGVRFGGNWTVWHDNPKCRSAAMSMLVASGLPVVTDQPGVTLVGGPDGLSTTTEGKSPILDAYDDEKVDA